MTTHKSNKSKNWLFIILALLILGGITWWVTWSIEDYNQQDDPMLLDLKKRLLPLDPSIEHMKLYKGNKSYTINKDKIYICLFDENGNYYPVNMLLYVVIHEISHFLNKEDVGHTEKFHQIFEELLAKATKLGIYNPSIPPIQGYCMHN